MGYKENLMQKNIEFVSTKLEKLLVKSGLCIKDKDFQKKFDEFLQPLFEKKIEIIEK